MNHVELKERPFSSNPMKDISKTGILFQQYVMDQISQDEFCEKMEEMQKKSEIVKETEQIEKNDLLCFFVCTAAPRGIFWSLKCIVRTDYVVSTVSPSYIDCGNAKTFI